MMATEKAKVASGKHAKHLMGTAITVGNGDTWKRIVSPNPRARAGKAKVQAVLMNLRKLDQRTLQLADLVCAHFEIFDDWKWNNCRKVTFTLDSGAAVSAAPKSLGDDYPVQIEETRSYKTATGSLVQDEGFRVLPIVTEERLHRCMNFRVAPVHKVLVSASKVCRKGFRIILDSEPGQRGMLHKHTNEWTGLREEKRCLRFRWLDFSGTDSREEKSEVVSLTPCEHNVDVAPVDFPRQENHP